MIALELDAKIEAMRAGGHEPRVILIERAELVSLIESLKVPNLLSVIGVTAIRLTTGPDGKYQFRRRKGYPSALQVAAYRTIPVIGYDEPFAESPCSKLAGQGVLLAPKEPRNA